MIEPRITLVSVLELGLGFPGPDPGPPIGVRRTDWLSGFVSDVASLVNTIGHVISEIFVDEMLMGKSFHSAKGAVHQQVSQRCVCVCVCVCCEPASVCALTCVCVVCWRLTTEKHETVKENADFQLSRWVWARALLTWPLECFFECETEVTSINIAISPTFTGWQGEHAVGALPAGLRGDLHPAQPAAGHPARHVGHQRRHLKWVDKSTPQNISCSGCAGPVRMALLASAWTVAPQSQTNGRCRAAQPLWNNSIFVRDRGESLLLPQNISWHRKKLLDLRRKLRSTGRKKQRSLVETNSRVQRTTPKLAHVSW